MMTVPSEHWSDIELETQDVCGRLERDYYVDAARQLPKEAGDAHIQVRVTIGLAHVEAELISSLSQLWKIERALETGSRALVAAQIEILEHTCARAVNFSRRCRGLVEEPLPATEAPVSQPNRTLLPSPECVGEESDARGQLGGAGTEMSTR